MKNLIFKIILLLSFTQFLFVACGSKDDHKNTNPVLETYRLVDEHRTDEAIELMESSLAQDPNNVEYKTVLASVYAHKAGIKIQNLVPVFNQGDKIKQLDKKLPEIEKKQGTSARINEGAVNIATLLTRFAGFFEAYAAIPIVTKEEAIYLNHAIYLLNEIGPSIKPEDVLYRAVLEVVLFKHILSENFLGEIIEPQTKNENSCRFNLENINNTLAQLGKLLVNIYHDIGTVRPDQAEEMNKRAQKVGDSVSDLLLVTTTMTVLDEAANIFLKQVAFQNGFGKIIKCGRN